MARTYNEQAPDGSWRQVTQNDNGTYTTQPIDPGSYSAANIPGSAPPAAGGGGSPPPGQATQAQMVAALQGAGYNGPWDDQSVADAYARTYNGGNAGAGGAGGSSAATYAFNKAAADSAANVAYQTAIIAGLSDRLAFDKATEAWNETFKQKQFETGQANTVVDQQFRQGQANNTNALSLLGLQSNLAGRPANAFEYAKLLTGTPGGLADIVRAAGGAYRLPQFGGGAAGNPTPLTLQTMIDDLNRYAPSGGGQAPATTPPATTAPPATAGAPGTYQTVNGVKTVEQMAQELHVAGWGGNVNDAAAVAAAYASTTKGAVTPNAATAPTATPPLGTVTTPGAGQTSSGAPPVGMTSAAQGAYQSQVFTGDKGAAGNWNAATTAAPGSQPYTQTSGGGYTGSGAQSNPIPGDVAAQSQYIPSYGPLQRGNQIAPQNWNIMDPSQQALYLDAQKNAGWLPEDILAQYQKSLKAYGGPVAGAVGF